VLYNNNVVFTYNDSASTAALVTSVSIPNVIGNEVKVQIFGNSKILSLAEVVVEALPPTTQYIDVEALTPLLDVNANNAAGTRCQGDCDSDAQCADNLVCFRRSVATDPLPPRCKGDIDTAVIHWATPQEYDWCVEANPIKLGLCEGECWTDDDCQGDLICSASTSHDCTGVGTSGWKYCVRG
jgi:hypothetical protein